MIKSLKGCLNGLFFTGFLFLTAFFGSIFIMGPFLPFMFLNEEFFRWYMDFAVNMWLILPGALFELLYGTKIVITGDKVKNNERSLIIMNHRCRLDWMFFWMVHLRTGRLSKEKIIMRGDLKNIPGFGWSMQNVLYMFLQRRWDVDHTYLDRMLEYFISINYPIQLFLFPEGTNLCSSNKRKSDAFAEKNGVEKFDYCLHPRVTGFTYLVQRLRGSIVDTVQDVTIAYPKKLCYGEVDLLTGQFPREIHVCFRNYKVNDLPPDSRVLDKWCMDRWVEKEERLKKFYENGSFVGEPVLYEETKLRYKIIMCAVLVFWSVFMCSVGCAIWWYPVVRWYTILFSSFYICTGVFGGTESLQLNAHYLLHKKQT